MRRGAAWPPAERPSSGLAVQPAVSRAGRWPHRRAVMVAERHVPPAIATRFGVPRRRGTRMSGCPPCLGRPVRVSVSVHMSSVRPSSDRRPVGVQRPRVRVSAGLVSSARCPCPVSGASVRHPCLLVRTGDFVERLGAAGSHTSRDRPGSGNYLTLKPVSRLIS